MGAARTLEHDMADVAVSQPATPRFGRFWNPTVFLCVAGIILPNALSLGALAAGIGSPPRTAAIIAYATVAVIARIVPAPLDHPAVPRHRRL